MIDNLYKKILLSDRLALSKAITLIESTKLKDKINSDKLIKKLFKKSGKSLRIGVSGPPGVGKSTFIEILGMFVRPFALTMRLGGNMTAGHIGMLAIFALPIILATAPIGIVSILLNTGIYFLEMIVSFVQAYVFTLLSAVFIGMAIHAEH